MDLGNCFTLNNIEEESEMLMYCGNCGKEIEIESTFFHECGAKIEIANNEMPKGDNPKIKKRMRLLRPVVMMIIIAFVRMKVFFYIQSIPPKEEIQMVAKQCAER